MYSMRTFKIPVKAPTLDKALELTFAHHERGKSVLIEDTLDSVIETLDYLEGRAKENPGLYQELLHRYATLRLTIERLKPTDPEPFIVAEALLTLRDIRVCRHDTVAISRVDAGTWLVFATV